MKNTPARSRVPRSLLFRRVLSRAAGASLPSTRPVI